MTLIFSRMTSNLGIKIRNMPPLQDTTVARLRQAVGLALPPTDATRFRSLVYVNRRVSTASHRQVPYDHPDVAAIKIWTLDYQSGSLYMYTLGYI